MSQNVTANELSRMPRGRLRYELVQGELRQMPLFGGEHGVVATHLISLLADHAQSNHLGIVFGVGIGFKIAANPDTVRAPDIAFIGHERIPASGIPRGFWPGAPDLAVEVVSPGDTVYEVDEKVEEWLAAGARAVWIVNPKRRTITIHRASGETTTLREDEQLSGEDVVPDFSYRVADIFI